MKVTVPPTSATRSLNEICKDAAGPTAAATYQAQLAERVSELLPDLSAGERLELLGAMDPDEMNTSRAWIAAMYPQVFDFAIVRDRALAGRLTNRLAANVRARIAAGEALADAGPSRCRCHPVVPGGPGVCQRGPVVGRGVLPSPAAAADAALMTSQLATNAILYSASGLPGGTFMVAVRVGTGRCGATSPTRARSRPAWPRRTAGAGSTCSGGRPAARTSPFLARSGQGLGTG